MTEAAPEPALASDAESASGASVRPWLLLFGAQVLFVAVMVAFLPALDGEFLDWDDTTILLGVDGYRGFGADNLRWMFSTYHGGHYQPITWLTYALDYTLWGMDPQGYHLTANLIHATNTVLVFLLIAGVLRRAFDGDGLPWWTAELGGFFAAAYFGLHPLRVESVAWLTERRDVVSALLLLLTMLAYLRMAGRTGGARWRWFAITLGLYGISMIAKVGGAPLPVALLVLDWFPLRRLRGAPWTWLGRGTRSVLLEKLPFLVIALFFSAMTVGQQADKWMWSWVDHDFIQRSAQACYGLVFYVSRTVVPVGLSPLYELRPPLNPMELRYLVSVAVVFVSGVVVLAMWRRWPALLAASLFYGIMIGPVLGYFQNGPQIVADRYSYLTCLPWLALACGLAAGWVGRGPALFRLSVVFVPALAVAIVFGVLTWRYCHVWQTSLRLWERVVILDPQGSQGNKGYGNALININRVEDAIPHFRQAVFAQPQFLGGWFDLWWTLNRLGMESELLESLEAGTDSPNPIVSSTAWLRLANHAAERDRFDEALDRFDRALEIRETFAEAHRDLGLLHERLGNEDDAVRHLKRALELDATMEDAQRALQRLGS